MSTIESLVLATLSSNSYLSINKNLIRSLGLIEAALLSEFISKYKHHKNKNELIDDCWFYGTGNNLEYNTGVSKYYQAKAINSLIEKGIIETKLMGLPARKYFKLSFETIQNQVLERFKNLESNGSKTNYNKNKYNNNIDNNIIINNNRESDPDSESFVNNSNQNNQSFDNKIKPVLDIPKGTPANCAIRLIGKWNRIESTSTHKTDKPYTKTYVNLIKDLIKLQEGTFFKNKIIDDKFIEQNKIPKKIFNKSWSLSELTLALNNVAKYSLEGYWPHEKNNFKSLPSLLYNPRTKKSWFINAFVNPPKKLQETIEEEMNSKPFETEYPRSMKQIKESPIWGRNKEFLPKEERNIENKIKKLSLWVDNLTEDIKDIDGVVSYWIGDLQKIIREYLRWLHEDKQDWIKKEIQIFDPDTKIFLMFIEDLENEIKFKVKSKGWKRK